MEEIEIAESEDMLLISEESLKSVLKYKKHLEEFTEEIAEIMDKMKTDKGKEALAELTRKNYAAMVELEENIVELEKSIKITKIVLLLGGLSNGISM